MSKWKSTARNTVVVKERTPKEWAKLRNKANQAMDMFTKEGAKYYAKKNAKRLAHEKMIAQKEAEKRKKR